ncbi:hydrogenase expression/formation protein HypE [Geoalkalibacter halelectricus]|uniref:Hydrogenase expression/formation protein HypE n=1 Tax=Geoalkalibacter halelectricus TaxID=2847045 RepID=A0ABY5ZJ65_9BACT|nr:hydrogenase expression/formation protein HypE [Geoalkalibacter halelectricus]MDO3377753.1 hydrogenase expression/formation protein HypE [Geoalkalibacter halelectricus]UWZ78653.1 hydrogenase expression/formation protein HypE [Geoalkalibacter halelectricus]
MTNNIILLGHGSGGKLSHQLLDDVIIPRLSGLPQREQNDAAVLSHGGRRLAFTTDSYVVDPIFFPGGDIGDLAVNGTVNDLAMSGARPLYLTVGLILEEGLPVADLERVLDSMKAAAAAAGVAIVAGDTKVVPRGKADKIFINTAGIGVFDHDLEILGSGARVGDQILVNGTIGDHGMAVLAGREGLDLHSDIQSDTAPLHELVADLIAGVGRDLHVLRDPTRGGVATTLKEIALQSNVDLTLEEPALPVGEAVRGACAILGLDPLYVANEGKLLALLAPEAAGRALDIMHRHPQGRHAAIIGEVTGASAGKVYLRTAIGGLRAIEMLAGEQLPRIC